MQPNFGAIPSELRSVPRWVVWRGAKVPFNASAINSTASVKDPNTWAAFDQAQTAYEEGGYQGVGFVLNGDGIVGVDLDKCVHAGDPEPEAMHLMERIGCQYIELSPSGTGLRGFGYADNIEGRKGKVGGVNVELYSSKRYLTVTGWPILQGPLTSLSGFSSIAEAIRPSVQTADLQKRTEDDRSNPLSSSVGIAIPAATLPSKEGQRNKCLFELARHLKGKMPEASRDELRVIVKRWHEMALPVIGTKDFSVTWADFVNGWEKVRQPHGATMNAIMAGINKSSPLPAGITSLGYGEHAFYLVRVCMALQVHAADKPFFISARQAGEVLGIHYTDAAKMLKALVADGVITLVSQGAGKVASRYRFTWGVS